MTRNFSGRHMLAIAIAFFGTIIAVNLVMARVAIETFGGTVVDNSYVASQAFNHWLDQAKAERALGWRLSAERDGDHAVVQLGGPCDAAVEAVAIHPLGRLPSLPLHFMPVGAGRFRSVEPMPAGRWRLELRVTERGRTAHFVDDVSA